MGVGFIIEMNPSALPGKGIFYFLMNMEMKLSKLLQATLVAIALTSLLIAAGCTSAPAPGNITDDLGRTVQIKEIPERIISLAPSNTEILFALGLNDKIVGVTEYCNYPPEAIEKPKVGGFSTVNIETVVSLTPDLLFATDIHNKTIIPALERLNFTVVALSPETLTGVIDDIGLVGNITGTKKESSKLTGDLQKRIDAVINKTGNLTQEQKPTVLYLTWHDPLMTAGKGTLADDVITMAGGINIAGDISGNNNITLETVIDRNPQIIVASVGMGSGEDLPWQYVNTESRLKTTEALSNNRVYKIDGDLIHRSGPRIVDALEIMAQFFHPELFQ
jgi:iron complex transport system substrate-binding protein